MVSRRMCVCFLADAAIWATKIGGKTLPIGNSDRKKLARSNMTPRRRAWCFHQVQLYRVVLPMHALRSVLGENTKHGATKKNTKI
jgi:hypothetical protein